MTDQRHEQFFSGLSWLLIVLALIGMAASLSYFGRNSSVSNASPSLSKTPRTPREYSVFYKSGVFGPTNLRIHMGDSVRFENQSFVGVRIISETVNNKLQLPDFDSKTEVAPNRFYIYTFQKIGTFGYHNFSNQDEAGSVIVRP